MYCNYYFSFMDFNEFNIIKDIFIFNIIYFIMLYCFLIINKCLECN